MRNHHPIPRHFTQADKDAIRTQLLDAGLRHFSQYGLRAMRVEDLCRDVGIAKGTFYNFFPHKEALFLAIADQRDAMHKAEILSLFENAPGSASDQAGRFFDMLVEKLQSDPLIAIVSVPEDLAAVMRKMPPERIAHEERKDRAFIVDFCESLHEKGLSGPVDPTDISGLLGLLVCLVLQKGLMSDDQFAVSCALLREMFILKIAGRQP